MESMGLANYPYVSASFPTVTFGNKNKTTPWTPDAAKHYAEIRADLKKKGQQLGSNDLLIAAHARSIGAVIVTNNVKDFGRVKGLKLENWME